MEPSTKAALSAEVRAATEAEAIKGFRSKLEQARREVIAEAKHRGIEISIIGRVIVVAKKPPAYYAALRKGLAFLTGRALDGLSMAEIKAAVAEHASFAAVGIGPKAWSSTKFPPSIIEYAESRLIEGGLMSETDRWDGLGKPRLDTFSKVAKFRCASRGKVIAETGRDFSTGRFDFLGNDQVNWFGAVRKLRRKGNGRTLGIRRNGKDYGVVAELMKLDKTLTKDTIMRWLTNAERAAQAARARAEAQAAAEAAERAAGDALDDILDKQGVAGR